MDFEETGYTLGLRFEQPFREDARAAYRVEAGGTFKHIEVEDEEGTIMVDTGHGAGCEAGAGVLLRFGKTIGLTRTL